MAKGAFSELAVQFGAFWLGCEACSIGVSKRAHGPRPSCPSRSLPSFTAMLLLKRGEGCFFPNCRLLLALLFDPSESDVKPSALPELAAASDIVLDPFSESAVRPSDRAFRSSLPHCSSTGAFFRAGGWLWHLSEIVQKFFTFSTILSCRHGLHDFCALRGFALMQALIERPCGMMGRHGYEGAPQQDHSGREIAPFFPLPYPP